jgi:hypothetical protein
MSIDNFEARGTPNIPDGPVIRYAEVEYDPVTHEPISIDSGIIEPVQNRYDISPQSTPGSDSVPPGDVIGEP